MGRPAAPMALALHYHAFETPPSCSMADFQSKKCDIAQVYVRTARSEKSLFFLLLLILSLIDLAR